MTLLLLTVNRPTNGLGVGIDGAGIYRGGVSTRSRAAGITHRGNRVERLLATSPERRGGGTRANVRHRVDADATRCAAT